jgi:hypothetical protein
MFQHQMKIRRRTGIEKDGWFIWFKLSPTFRKQTRLASSHLIPRRPRESSVPLVSSAIKVALRQECLLLLSVHVLAIGTHYPFALFKYTIDSVLNFFY